MELEVWNGDWGLPTADFKCLQMLTLLKLSDVQEVNLKGSRTNNPFNFPNRYLPLFTHQEEQITEFKDLVAHLNTKNLCADLNLGDNTAGESYAYCYMIEEKLYPALNYTWWIDTENYKEVTRPLYSAALSFPFNFFYPSHYKKVYETEIFGLYQHIDEEEKYVTEIYREAEKCLACLSSRLAGKDFFFGAQPSSLDAVVYGCLAPLVKAPLPSNVLQNHVKASPNLLQFITRIDRRYFFAEILEYNKRLEKKKENLGKVSEFLPNKKRNKALAILFAVGASLLYGFTTGIFTISASHGESDDVLEIDDSEE